MELFETKEENILPPLAERMRPSSLEEFIGQKHLTGEGKIIRKSLETGNIFSMILWGPPGSGKTTLARIIASTLNAKFYQLSAVSSGVGDLRKVIEAARWNKKQGKKTILFIDEIHRFTKAQQDALLHSVEDGTITLIGATTENPSFEVIPPLISRCRVLKLFPLSDEELLEILENTIKTDILLSKFHVKIEDRVRDFLIRNSNGDARKLLNAIETIYHLSNPEEGKEFIVTEELVKEALQQRKFLYDKKGDYHYDTISAFIKSVRGSDPNAAVYWLAVMLEGGEDPLFIARRLIILASEDIGNADPQAIVVASAGFQAVHAIGMPEAAIVLAQVTTYLASAPKSNAAYLAINMAMEEVRKGELPDVPLHLRNAPTKLMDSLGYGKDYKYPHNFEGHFVKENYFPKHLKPQAFYLPTDQGYEKFIRERLRKLWPDRYKNRNKTQNEK